MNDLKYERKYFNRSVDDAFSYQIKLIFKMIEKLYKMENVTEFSNKTVIFPLDMAGIFISNEFLNIF